MAKDQRKGLVRKLLRLFQVRGHEESQRRFVLPMKVQKGVGYARVIESLVLGK